MAAHRLLANITITVSPGSEFKPVANGTPMKQIARAGYAVWHKKTMKKYGLTQCVGLLNENLC